MMSNHTFICINLFFFVFFGILIFLDNSLEKDLSDKAPAEAQQIQQQTYPQFVIKCIKAEPGFCSEYHVFKNDVRN